MIGYRQVTRRDHDRVEKFRITRLKFYCPPAPIRWVWCRRDVCDDCVEPHFVGNTKVFRVPDQISMHVRVIGKSLHIGCKLEVMETCD